VQGLGEEGFPGPGFHQLAGVHHPHLVGHAGHHAEVVGDQQHAHAAAGLQLGKQVEDLGLDRHVEGRGGLIGDQHLGVAGEGDGDHHPLLHAAGELEGIFGEASAGVGDAHRGKQALGLVPGRLAVEAAVADQHLADLVADRHDRIEAGRRLLEDHRQMIAADVAHARLGERMEGRATQVHGAGGDAPSGGEQTHAGQGGHRLAAAGLAHQGQGLAGGQREADAVDGAHGAGRGTQLDLQVGHGEQRRWSIHVQSVHRDEGRSPAAAGRQLA